MKKNVRNCMVLALVAVTVLLTWGGGKALAETNYQGSRQIGCSNANYVNRPAVTGNTTVQSSGIAGGKSSNSIVNGNVEEKVFVNLQVGNKNFQAEMSDNASAKAFMERLPLSIDMGDLNANEKYYFMKDSIPGDAKRVGRINSGDIMLYGSDCVVLFYETFDTSYSYTRLGSVTDAAGLKDALSSGDVHVTWSVLEK